MIFRHRIDKYIVLPLAIFIRLLTYLIGFFFFPPFIARVLRPVNFLCLFGNDKYAERFSNLRRGESHAIRSDSKCSLHIRKERLYFLAANGFNRHFLCACAKNGRRELYDWTLFPHIVTTFSHSAE